MLPVNIAPISYNKRVIYWKIMPLSFTKNSYYDSKKEKWFNLHPGKKAIIKTFVANNKYLKWALKFWIS